MKNVHVKYYILINRGQAFKTSHALFSVMIKPFILLIYTKVTTRNIIQSLRTFQLYVFTFMKMLMPCNLSYFLNTVYLCSLLLPGFKCQISSRCYTLCESDIYLDYTLYILALCVLPYPMSLMWFTRI